MYLANCIYRNGMIGAAKMNLFAVHTVTGRSNLLLAGYWTKLALEILISDIEIG